MFLFKKFEEKKRTFSTVFLCMNDDSNRSKEIVVEGGEYTIPSELPFDALPGMVFRGWSKEPFGDLLTSDETIEITKDTFLYARYTIKLTFDPNEGAGTAFFVEIDQQKDYALPSTTDFIPPVGKTFDGWRLTADGNKIDPNSIVARCSRTIYVNWVSGYENWIQILNYSDPQSVSTKDGIFEYHDSAKLYTVGSDKYIYNGIELTPFKVSNIVNSTYLPALAASDVIYHLTSDNTYWHFEYDVIKMTGGFPARGDDNFWEQMNLLNANSPLIANNNYEFYYMKNQNRNYYYNYNEKAWKIQNSSGPEIVQTSTIDVSKLKTLAQTKPSAKNLYKVTTSAGGYNYYVWCRLVEEEFHQPQRPKVDPTIYWIITSAGVLYISAHPIIYSDVSKEGNFPSSQTFPEGVTSGPWFDYKSSITKAVVLEDISPASLSHWFDWFPKLTDIVGLEKIHTDYTESMSSAFAILFNIFERRHIDLSAWNTPCLVSMGDMFTSFDAGGTPRPTISIDLSQFDTSKVKNMNRIFRACASLEHVYVGDKWTTANATEYSDIFAGDTKLHNFDSRYVDKTKAIIDDGTNGGYLERKQVISLYPNGGVGDITKRFVIKNGSFTLPENLFTPPKNKAFLGWSTTKSEEDIIKTSTITITEDIALYAIWTERT